MVSRSPRRVGSMRYGSFEAIACRSRYLAKQDQRQTGIQADSAATRRGDRQRDPVLAAFPNS